ncbi:MAG TPA: ABC transporter substrate-binding protein [Chloroflexota bacterium]|jgi:branched-chain amino acid transport system substrate-binding protein
MRKKWFGPVVTLTLALAACGGSAAPASPSTAAAPSSTAAKPSAAASAAASAPASAKPAGSAAASAKPAASAGASAASGAPIKIGLLQPLTGIYANQGIDHSDGFKLYLESIGNTAAGRPIQLIVSDDQGQPDTGLTKAKQLVENDKVQILAGGTITPECYALYPYAKEAQVPFVNTGNCIGYDLTTSPKYASPYGIRISGPLLAGTDPLADWASKNGYKKGILMSSDYAAGHQIADAFASAFVSRGGSIVQEQYPAQGTADFGPFLAKLDKSADFVFSFFPGVDGLRMMQAFDQYADPSKVRVLDYGTAIASGPNVAQLKDKAVGVTGGATLYVDTIDSPANQALVKAFKAKFPSADRFVDADVDRGYDGAGFIVAAIKAANGNVEDRSPNGSFIKALASTQYEGARGPIKLDADRDVVQNQYIQQVVKNGNAYSFKILATYPNVGKEWDRTKQEIEKFPFGTLGGKWPTMTKDQLAGLVK